MLDIFMHTILPMQWASLTLIFIGWISDIIIYTTLTNLSTYLVLCKDYTDVGGIN